MPIIIPFVMFTLGATPVQNSISEIILSGLLDHFCLLRACTVAYIHTHCTYVVQVCCASICSAYYV